MSTLETSRRIVVAFDVWRSGTIPADASSELKADVDKLALRFTALRDMGLSVNEAAVQAQSEFIRSVILELLVEVTHVQIQADSRLSMVTERVDEF